MSIWEAWQPDDDRDMNTTLQEAMARGRAEGLTDSEVVESVKQQIEEALPHAIGAATAGIRESLRRDAPAMLRDHARLRRGFERRIEWVWGEALDLLFQLIVICEEVGAEINDVRRPTAARSNDQRFEALVTVHARACATASEIHALLRTGYARGAYARWRTLHELAVVSTLLREGDQELARRFLLHAVVEEYSGVLKDEQYRERNPGVGPPHPEVLEVLQQDHDAVLAEFGTAFAKDWMWAQPLTVPDRPTFRRLEELAGLDHLRPNVRMANHLVHAGSIGTAAIRAPFRGGTVLVSGASNQGLAEPGEATAISLVQATLPLCLVGADEGLHPMGLAAMEVMNRLATDANEAFSRAARQLEQMELDYAAARQRGRVSVYAFGAARRLSQRQMTVVRKVRGLRSLTRRQVRHIHR